MTKRNGQTLILSGLFLLCSLGPVLAQTMEDYAVQLECTTSGTVPYITLNWSHGPGAPSGYTVYRKLPDDLNWQLMGNLGGTITTYADATALPNQTYEYRVKRNGSNFFGNGYMICRSELPAVHSRGSVLLLVEAGIAASLSIEIERLQMDLVGDGWKTHLRTVNSLDVVTAVKQQVMDVATADPELKSLFILGHLPVPYSGQLYPDGHTEHEGAWPTDHYYADINDPWTDDTTDLATAARPANWNVPADGKFDRSAYYAGEDIDLEVGRVDLSNLPSAGMNETELTRRYLDRDHDFRTAQLNIPEKAGVDYYFDTMSGEAIAANGYLNFAPIVGRDSTGLIAFNTVLLTQDRLFTSVCGSGSYTSMAGVGSSYYFQNPMGGVFNMMFGSYFGDWDNTDNLLRAPLAGPGSALVNMWAGRPYWYFHQMALGETIGRGARRSMNNKWYHANYCGNCIHTGLMGDPTLRAHPLAQPTNLLALADGLSTNLTWNPPTVQVDGYYVYRSTAGHLGPYQLLTATPSTNTNYTDSPIAGSLHYMVRSVQLKETPSGSYHNLSVGIVDSVDIEIGVLDQSMLPTLQVVYGTDQHLLTCDVKGQFTKGNLELVDATGRILGALDCSTQGRYSFSLNGIPVGVYLITLRNEKGTTSKRFVR